MTEASKFSKSLRSPFQWIGVSIILLLFFGAIGLNEIHPNLGPRAAPALESSLAIKNAMFQYARDHNDAYPTGRSSTEVFQKLIDGGYIADPSIFWCEDLKVPGKIKTTSRTLKPENICWDVTVPLNASSSDYMPVVFSTGFRLNYVPGGSATPLFPLLEKRPLGIAVSYYSGSTSWKDAQSNGIITNFIDTAFDPTGKKYQQLTPDGPLP